MTELDRIRSRLMERRAVVHERVGRIKADMRREREPLSRDFDDQAIQRENDEVLDSILANDMRELRELDDALARLDRGRYGRCESCGSPIEHARLEALPFAHLCSACAQVR